MFPRLAIPIALCLHALFSGLKPAPAYAGTLPLPTVSYSADRTIESDAGTMTGKVYASQGMERQETNISGMQSVIILRHDKQVGYVLMPSQHMYQQLDLATAQKQSSAQAADLVDITKMGYDKVEGSYATKYKMQMKDGSAGGFIWINSHNIPVKVDVVSKNGRKMTRMTLTLRNVQIGVQDPQLFEVPQDFTATQRFGGVMEMPG